ncbi:DUF4835 family protein [Elizabethkingia sp. JS20170427COW]|uniref:type IX secretion system protein PorD n=1 Tax=Elizabethkingia sp. JS20170427COW TaxID=2583851 RepID=UPI00110FFB52|nr:DUF4835 family protein [Elizabethkingia sp. JS20170427COW]QCX53205.1 DUF4835 family protein [Elizabethkingia sp. JS20170427COW]
MKKIIAIFLLSLGAFVYGQELQANVTVSAQQIGGSNQQVYRTLEKSLKDFINNTSWTGRRLQSFEKVKCAFSIIISERNSNSFKGSIIVQSTRPVYKSLYDSPILNINDQNFSFEYIENENFVFNDRQFSGKNLIDVVGFYVYLILGYDADSFQAKGGTPWFEKSQKIARNAVGQQKYEGWNPTEGPRVRGTLIDRILAPSNNNLRNIMYGYHRLGLDLLSTNETQAKQSIFNQLMGLQAYESDFQMNYPFSLFIDGKKTEIFNIFNTGNNGSVNLNNLRNLLNTMAPKESDIYWNKWK